MHCCHTLPWPCSHVHALQEVEAAYNDKPYHNSMHAADVTQSVGALLATDGFSDQLTDLELLAVILASAVHDVGHPGERWSLAWRVSRTGARSSCHRHICFGLQVVQCPVLMRIMCWHQLTSVCVSGVQAGPGLP